MSAITAKASRKMKKYAVLTREPRCFLGSFDFSWEQRKFGEIASKYEDPVPTPHDGYYRLGIRSHAKGTFHSYVAKGQELETAQMHRVAAGNFIVNITFGWEHAVAITDENDAGKLVSHRFPQFSFAEGMVPEFFRYVIVDEKFRHHLWLASPGGAGRNRVLKLDDMLNYLMRFPSRDEQIKIAEFFRQLDHLITLHQRKSALLFSPFQAFISMMFTTSTFSWEQRKLSEMCGTFEYGLNAAAKEFDGKNKYIRITDIDDASREFLLSDLSSPDICLDGMSKYLLSSGDIVFARTGASVGKTYIYRENDGIVYFAGFLIRAKVNQDNDAEFVFQSTLSPSYEKYIRITSQRSGQPGVNAQEYGEYDLFAPSKEEQQRIGHFLRGIDNLITLHQRKCIFFTGRAGRLISTVNKKRITSSWEQRKLGELALFNPKDELPQTFEYVDLESVVGTEMLSHRTEVKSSAPSRAQRLAHTGDLFYQTVRPYQKNNYLFEKPDNNYVFSTGYAQMRPYVDGYFLLSLVQSERFVKVVLDNCTGTSYPAINANDLAEIEVAAPSDESEAQRIGTIFRSIDNLITLHQRKPFLMKWRTSDANRNQTNRLVL